MTELDEQIATAEASVAEALAVVHDAEERVIQAFGAWIVAKGLEFARSRVVTDMPERATALGPEVVQRVKAAADRMHETTLPALRERLKPYYFPLGQLSDRQFARRWSSFGDGSISLEVAFRGALPDTWVDVARDLIEKAISPTLIDTGFVDDDHGRSPSNLRAARDLKDVFDSYDAALHAYVNRESTRRDLVKKREQGRAADIWDA